MNSGLELAANFDGKLIRHRLTNTPASEKKVFKARMLLVRRVC